MSNPDIQIKTVMGSLVASPLTDKGREYCKRYKGVYMKSFLITSGIPDDMLKCGLTLETIID